MFQKKTSINFSKTITKFCLNLHYNGDESHFYVNKTEICNLKANDNISCCIFGLGSKWKDFTKDEQIETSSIGTVCDFSLDHSSIKKEDILNVHQYLMNIFLKKCLLDY